jgi:hypothetical protein
MSQRLHLPDSVYKALQQAAKASGTSLADWITRHLPETGPTNEESLEDDWSSERTKGRESMILGR